MQFLRYPPFHVVSVPQFYLTSPVMSTPLVTHLCRQQKHNRPAMITQPNNTIGITEKYKIKCLHLKYISEATITITITLNYHIMPPFQ